MRGTKHCLIVLASCLLILTMCGAPSGSQVEPNEPAPSVTAQSIPSGVVVYPCRQGLCRRNIDGTDGDTLVSFDPQGQTLYGFALSHDGTHVIYALGERSDSAHAATLSYAALDGSQHQELFSVEGMPGFGGFGVLGLTSDDQQVIFEDRAQIFVAGLNGSDRRAVTPCCSADGTSSGYQADLSPTGTKVMVMSYSQRGTHAVVIYEVSTGASLRYDAGSDLDVIGFGTDEGHVLAIKTPVQQANPPYDEEVKEFYELDLLTQMRRLVLRAVGTIQYPNIISNISRGHALFEDVRPTQAANTLDQRLFLLDMARGLETTIQLPDFRTDWLHNRVALYLTS